MGNTGHKNIRPINAITLSNINFNIISYFVIVLVIVKVQSSFSSYSRFKPILHNIE